MASTDSNTMLALQVTDWSEGPKLTHIPKPSPPSDSSTVQVRVTAVGVHSLVRGRAAGRHYSAKKLPHTPGVDGTGIDPATGRKVFFSMLSSPESGTIAEYVNVPAASVAEIPEGVDPVAAAGLVNPVMSSWMALRYRVDKEALVPNGGWTCLIMGVTSASGRLAVRTARAMGAGKVIGAARSEGKMKTIDGLDGHIVLQEDPTKTDFSPALQGQSIIVLDYLWGPWAPAYLTYASSNSPTHGEAIPTTWVTIGALAGPLAEGMPAAALRGEDFTIRGAGLGSWAVRKMDVEVEGMMGVLKGMSEEEKRDVFGLRSVSIQEGGESVWKEKGDGRVVLTLGEQ